MLLLLVFVIPRIDRCPGDLAIFSSRCFSRATRRPTLSDGSPDCPWCCDETLILACTGLTLTNTDAASHSIALTYDTHVGSSQDLVRSKRMRFLHRAVELQQDRASFRVLFR